ncbi:unnamed protein product, partial [Prorocentrum cordatum]
MLGVTHHAHFAIALPSGAGPPAEVWLKGPQLDLDGGAQGRRALSHNSGLSGRCSGKPRNGNCGCGRCVPSSQPRHLAEALGWSAQSWQAAQNDPPASRRAVLRTSPHIWQLGRRRSLAGHPDLACASAHNYGARMALARPGVGAQAPPADDLMGELEGDSAHAMKASEAAPATRDRRAGDRHGGAPLPEELPEPMPLPLAGRGGRGCRELARTTRGHAWRATAPRRLNGLS